MYISISYFSQQFNCTCSNYAFYLIRIIVLKLRTSLSRLTGSTS